MSKKQKNIRIPKKQLVKKKFFVYLEKYVNLLKNYFMDNLKDQLKAASESELVALVNNVTEQLRSGRYRKVEVQRDVITVLSQRKPRVCAATRSAYQSFIYNVCGVAAKNQDVLKRAKNFARANGLDWK